MHIICRSWQRTLRGSFQQRCRPRCHCRAFLSLQGALRKGEARTGSGKGAQPWSRGGGCFFRRHPGCDEDCSVSLLHEPLLRLLLGSLHIFLRQRGAGKRR